MHDKIKEHALVKSFHQNYLSYEYKGKSIKLPAVHVKLINPINNNSFKTFALVDSGATVSFLPWEFVNILNLKIGESSSATGAGGEFDTNLSTILIEVTKVTSVQYRDEIQIHIPKEIELPYAILGRNSIFLYFNILFRENEQDIVFRQIKHKKVSYKV